MTNLRTEFNKNREARLPTDLLQSGILAGKYIALILSI